MYPVSAAYKTAIQQSVRDVSITGTITLKDNTVINVTDEDIVQGSLYITEQCVSGEDIEVGNVYASEMGLALSTPLENPYSLDGARIILNFGIDVGGGIWEYVPLGYFYVTEIERKARSVDLTALDGMLLFDIPADSPEVNTPRDIIMYVCSKSGITLGTALADIDALPNAGVQLIEPDPAEIKSCRDLLMWACQIMGCFARMNRQGELEVIPIKAKDSVKIINKSARFNSDVSDFLVKITKVNMPIGETEYSRGYEGMSMLLEENPLMAGLSADQINQMLYDLFTQITTVVYVPFSADFAGDPALQPGDFVTLADTNVLGGGDVVSIITHSTWRYRGPHNLKGAGKSEFMRGVQNQKMKAVSSIVAIAKAAQGLALSAEQSTQLIKDAIGGHVLIRQAPDETNEILIMDNPDPEQATKIWRWNMGGLGYSDNVTGADNPEREYEVAMTMDGAINATFIKTGLLDSSVVRIGPESYFEPGYDPSKIDGVSMGLDEDCVGLWHLDGSLNSHKGVRVESDADFGLGCFGRAVNIATGKQLKVPTIGMNVDEGVINFRAKGLAESANGSVLIDVLDNEGNQGMVCGIADDGRLFMEDAKLQISVNEDSQDDFNTGTLSNVVATSEGVLELMRDGEDFSYIETTQSDFESGTLTDVVVTSAGDLELAQTMNNALCFDGVDDYVQIANSTAISPTQAITVEAWILANTVTKQYMSAIEKPFTGATSPFFDYQLSLSNDSCIRFRLATAEAKDTNPLVPGIWYHVAGTYDGSNIKLYVNGDLKATTPYTDIINASGMPLILGKALNYSGREWDGKIDDVRIWSVARTQQQIQDNMYMELGGNESGLAGYWKFNEDGENTAYDSTVNANNGTIYGALRESADRVFSDFTKGKTYSSDSYEGIDKTASMAFDNNEATRWLSGGSGYPHWIQVDLGDGVTKIAKKIRFKPQAFNGASRVKNFKLQGSSNGILWTDIYVGLAENTDNWQEFILSNSVGYRFYRIYGIDSYDTSLPNYMSIWEIEIFEYVAIRDYISLGTREKIVDLSGVNPAGGTKIEWSKTTPTNTTIKVETALSTDGGTTYGAYAEATSGQAIPGIASDTDLGNAKLKIKETLSTSDTSVTPQLHSLTLSLYTVYKASGYRHKEYDISAVGSVGSSKISWAENNPANTTLTVKAAVSTDGGITYGSFQNCTSGQSIPGLTQGMDISNARLKVQEDLATSDGTKTPQLQSLMFEIGSNTQRVYGSDKSELVIWDSISFAWNYDRLSLVVNDAETCYIESPALPIMFGDYLFIGTDHNGANAINTFIDELRIDKVYRDVATRAGWHNTGVPFYTSEDMKQWPGYMQLETDGLKVYDSSNALRVLLGSWLKDAVRKYGLKIIGGEIYSSIIRSGAEDATSYIQLSPGWRPLEVRIEDKKALDIWANNSFGGMIQFYNPGLDDMMGQIFPMNDDGGTGLRIQGRDRSGKDRAVDVAGSNVNLTASNVTIRAWSGDHRCDVWGLLWATSLSVAGSKNCIEETENYGTRALAARESPETRYVDEGMGTLVNGECRIDVDPIFMECIEPHMPDSKWLVHLSPYADVDIYVAEMGPDYFIIREKKNGTTTGAEFAWSLSAVRKNYAHMRLQEVFI